MKIGYACINTILRKQNIHTNRRMTKKTFEEKGLSYVSELALKNSADLFKILKWNEENDIDFFRISSGILPWYGFYKFEDLPHAEEIVYNLKMSGDFAKKHNHRLTTHPDHFVKMASEKTHIVANSITDLEMHGFIFDLMGLSNTHYNKINIHIGQGSGKLKETARRFLDNIKYLPDSVLSRLTVENDDKRSLYSMLDLYELIYSRDIKIPLVLDIHHHKIHNKGLNISSAAELSFSTWPDNIVPVVHLSSSKLTFENVNDEKIKEQAHADYIYDDVDIDLPYEVDFDVMFEAKMKEQSVLRYKKKLIYN